MCASTSACAPVVRGARLCGTTSFVVGGRALWFWGTCLGIDGLFWGKARTGSQGRAPGPQCGSFLVPFVWKRGGGAGVRVTSGKTVQEKHQQFLLEDEEVEGHLQGFLELL